MYVHLDDKSKWADSENQISMLDQIFSMPLLYKDVISDCMAYGIWYNAKNIFKYCHCQNGR